MTRMDEAIARAVDRDFQRILFFTADGRRGAEVIYPIAFRSGVEWATQEMQRSIEQGGASAFDVLAAREKDHA